MGETFEIHGGATHFFFAEFPDEQAGGTDE